jgi:carbon-monoxide dehydrogenase large subunit
VTYVGERITGLNNRRLAAGKGMFVADVTLPGMTHAAVVRSPFAHARVRSVDVEAARALPGVLCVVTGEEIRERTNPIPGSWEPADMGAKEVDWYALAPDRVRYVGEAVAAVVAETAQAAREAANLVDVDYEELPAVLDPVAALADGAPLVEPEWGDNVLVSRDFSVGEPEEAFAQADGVVEGTVFSNRITGTPIETRGVVAHWEPYKPQLTVWDSTQDPHPLRVFLAQTLRMPENHVRVVQPHVGGAFGLKQPTFQEEPLVAYLSMKLARPVRWIEERDVNFMVGGHARDTEMRYRAAYQDDGTITAIDIAVIADVGAPTALCGYGMSFVTWYCLPTVYRIRNARMSLRSVVTNKCPWNSYRGYGKDAASFLMERVVDHVARELGTDRAELRFKNFIQPDEFPWSQPSGAMLDSGNYPELLRKLLDLVGWADFPAYQAAEREKGRRVGLGLAMELTPEGASVPNSLIIGGFDGSTVRVGPTGDVMVFTGVTSPGSGNETAMAQIAAEALGCRIERVKVIQGDTDSCPWGLGNYSSRSIMIGGSAVKIAADRISARMREVAAQMLEANPSDLVAAEERFHVEGNPASGVGFDEVIAQFYRRPHGEFMESSEPALEETHHFRIGNVYHQEEKQGRFSTYPTWPYGAAACVVAVDEETGFVDIERYCYVHDAGRIINPLLAEANLHGGITQGIGSAMYEEIRYDDAGQPNTTTFMDYTIPTAVEAPRYEIDHIETLSPFTPLGAKGVGESGMGSALGALCSAVESALPELPLRFERLPLTPQNVWTAIQRARALAGDAVGAQS